LTGHFTRRPADLGEGAGVESTPLPGHFTRRAPGPRRIRARRRAELVADPRPPPPGPRD